MADAKHCQQCGARNDSPALSCWLCNARLDAPSTEEKGFRSDLPVPALQQAESAPVSFSLSTLMLVMTLIAVACGMVAVAPGLGILLAIVSLPVFARTVGVVRKRQAAGLPTSATKRGLLFVGSLFATLTMTVVVCVASIGTFCGLCLGLGSIDGFSEGSVALGVSVAIPCAIAATFGAIVLARKWAKARWRRDIEQS